MNRPSDMPARSHAACAVAVGVRANATATSIPTVTVVVARRAAAETRYGSRRRSVTHKPDAPATSASAASRSASRIVTFAGSPIAGRRLTCATLTGPPEWVRGRCSTGGTIDDMKYMTAIPRGSRLPRGLFAALILLTGLIVTSCAPSGAGASGSPASLAGRYRVSGGGGTIPVITALTNRFTELHPGVLWDIENVGSDAAIASVKSSEADLGGVSREMTAPEQASVQSLQIGVSGTAVVVNAANPVGNLTKAQIRSIFSGEIKDWSQVGGTPGEIRVFVREATAATRVIFDDYIFGGKPAYRADFTPVDSADQTTKAVTSFKDAVSMLTITDAALTNTAIKLLPVDGVAPTIDNLTTGKYAMRRPLFMVYSKDKVKPAIAALVDFAKSPEGQKIITGK